MTRTLDEARKRILDGVGSGDLVGTLLSPEANSFRLEIRKKLREQREERFKGMTYGRNIEGINQLRPKKTNQFTYAYKQDLIAQGNPYKDANAESGGKVNRNTDMDRWLEEVNRSIYRNSYRSTPKSGGGSWDLPDPPKGMSWDEFAGSGTGKAMKWMLKQATQWYGGMAATGAWKLIEWGAQAIKEARIRNQWGGMMDPNSPNFVPPPGSDAAAYEEWFNKTTMPEWFTDDKQSQKYDPTTGEAYEVKTPYAQGNAPGQGTGYVLSGAAANDMSGSELTSLLRSTGGNLYGESNSVSITAANKINSYARQITGNSITGYDPVSGRSYGYATRIKGFGSPAGPKIKEEVKVKTDDE